MRTEKLSLKNIKNVLSRSEMKRVMAGSGGGGCNYGSACNLPFPEQNPICCSSCVTVIDPLRPGLMICI